MALDVYVMPLWRFKAGDYDPALERALGLEPEVIYLSGSSRPGLAWYRRFLAKFGKPVTDAVEENRLKRIAAQEEVRKLKEEMTGLAGLPIDWPDEGDEVLGQQFYHPEEMQAFAAWHDHRDELPVFEHAPEGDYYKHPARHLPEPQQRRFPTLVDHSLHTGYLLPVPFEGVYKAEPFKIFNHWEAHRCVASSDAMLRETMDFLEFMADVEASESCARGGANMKQIRWYGEELKRMCELSLEHRLPVIFHG